MSCKLIFGSSFEVVRGKANLIISSLVKDMNIQSVGRDKGRVWRDGLQTGQRWLPSVPVVKVRRVS